MKESTSTTAARVKRLKMVIIIGVCWQLLASSFFNALSSRSYPENDLANEWGVRLFIAEFGATAFVLIAWLLVHTIRRLYVYVMAGYWSWTKNEEYESEQAYRVVTPHPPR